MRRSAILLAMLFAILWQSVAMARVGPTVNVLADLHHAALHWQEKPHHHHKDGSYHQDGSKESVQHVAADHVNASLAPVASSTRDLAPLGSTAPDGLHQTVVQGPTLDGLLRPPRSHS